MKTPRFILGVKVGPEAGSKKLLLEASTELILDISVIASHIQIERKTVAFNFCESAIRKMHVHSKLHRITSQPRYSVSSDTNRPLQRMGLS
jgi:hypothetical protein